MEGKSHRCVLGTYRLVRSDPATDKTLARKSYITGFNPSDQCFQLMERVAEGIAGIAAVVRTTEVNTTFAIVFDNGIDADATASLWVSKFQRAAQRVPKERRGSLVGGSSFKQPDPYRELVATYSDRYSSDDS